MINLSSSSKILLCIKPLDFRKGIDSICRIVKADFEKDPREGAIYVFINKRATQIRLINFDGTGFWLCTKRLSQGNYWWPKSKDSTLLPSEAKDMAMLLRGQNPGQESVYSEFRKVV